MDNDNYKKPKRSSLGSIKFFSSDFPTLENEDPTFTNPKSTIPPFYSVSSKLPSKSKTSHRQEGTTSVASSAGNARQINDWINEKSLSNIRDNHSSESKSVRNLYKRVLSNEENFVMGIEEFLHEQDLLKHRRKELLHKKWHNKVYVPIRKQVEKSIESGFQAVDEQRRKDYSSYLQYKNKKDHVFLDVVSPDEYNPFNLHGSSSPVALRAKTGRLSDPLHTSYRQKMDEEKVILRCETGDLHPNSVILSRRLPPQPLIPLGREGTKCSTWLSMTLRNVDSPDRTRSRLRMNGKSNQTDIDFATWSNTRFEPVVTDKELRIQRKRRFKIPSTMPMQSLLETPAKPCVRFSVPPVTTTVEI